MTKMNTKRTKRSLPTEREPNVRLPARLLTDIRGLIEDARQNVARSVNSALVLLYWQVGNRIKDDVLKQKRAGYGDRIVATLSCRLTADYGRGFGRRNLFRMIRFAEVFSDPKIVSALMAQLGWTHFLHIIALDDPLKRDFYAEMCRLERWSTRTLEKKIAGMIYERTALAKKPEQVIRHELDALRKEDQLTPDLVFKDPYLLDFLGLNDRYIERDIEDAISTFYLTEVDIEDDSRIPNLRFPRSHSFVGFAAGELPLVREARIGQWMPVGNRVFFSLDRRRR